MKTQRFAQMDYQLESRCDNSPRKAFASANVDPAALQVAARQNERRRIAQELHDTLLQGFTGLALKLDALTSGLPPSLSKTKQQLQQALDQMDHYLEEARRAIWELRSPALESTEDFSTALLEAGERAITGTDIILRFSVKGSVRKIEKFYEHNLLRICEEAVANAVKHANPTLVELLLEFNLEDARLSIRDNGCGFDPTQPESSRKGHFGLLGIKERAASVFGKLWVDSAPGRGTLVHVTIPTQGTRRSNGPSIPEVRCTAHEVLVS